MEISTLKEVIRQAREAVEGEEEPYRIEAFKVILTNLLNEKMMQRVKHDEIEGVKSGQIPEDILQNLSSLKNKEKIQVLLYYSERALTKDEIKEKSKYLGIDEGWWNGSNFRRDLMKREHLVVEEKGEDGKTRYRLTDTARATTKKLVDELKS